MIILILLAINQSAKVFMKRYKIIIMLVLIGISQVVNAQRYFHYDLGVNYSMPKAEITVTNKPGFYFGFGFVREFSERFSVKTGTVIGVYRNNLIGYDLKQTGNYFYDSITVSTKEVKQTAIVINYDLAMCFTLIEDRLSVYGGLNLGIFPYVRTQDVKNLVFTNYKFNTNQTYESAQLDKVSYLNEPLFDANDFLYGPKFGVGILLNNYFEINIEYLMFLNTLYSDDAQDVSGVIGDYKLNILQAGIIYKLKPSPEYLRF